MADQSVKINVGSSYDGSGMNKANDAVNTLSRTAGKAAGAVGRIGTAFGGISGEAGKAVGAIASFASAFATGGAIGVAMTAITGLISVWKTLNDEIYKTNEAKFDNIINGLKEVNTEASKAAESLDKAGDKLKQENIAQGKAKAAQVKGEAGKSAVNTETELKNLEVDYATAKKKVEEFKFAEDRLKESVDKLKHQYDEAFKQMQMGTANSNSIWGASGGGGSGALSSIKKALDEAEKELKAARQNRKSAMASVQAKETQIEEARANLYMQEELARQEMMSKIDDEAEKTDALGRAKVLETEELKQLVREQEQQRYQDLLTATSDEVDATERLARAKMALAEQIENQALEQGFDKERNRLQQWNDAQAEADQLVKIMKDIQSDMKNKNLTEQQRAEMMSQLREIDRRLEDIKKKNPNVNVAVNVGGGGGNGGNGGGGGGNMPNVYDVLDGNNPNSPFQPRNDFGTFRKPKGHDQRKIKSHADWLRKRGFDPDDLLKQLGEDPTKKIAGNTDTIVRMMQNGGMK